jgi:hypothetical protein
LSLALLIAVFAASGAAWGRTAQAYIDGVSLRRGPRSDLLLGFRVQKAFDQHILDTLDTGLPVRFTYWIRLERPKGFLKDDVVREVRLDRSLVKDNLQERYRVTLQDGGETQNFFGLTEAVEAMTRVEGVSLLPLSALQRKGPQFLKIKAQLQKFRLPFHLHYVFAFVSHWDVETDWYVLELPKTADSIP